MLELMKIGDIIENSTGIIFAGTNEKFENVSYSIVKRILTNISTIDYIDKHQVPRSTQVIALELHPSIGNNFNIFLLVKESDIEKSPKDGEIIYCAENDELSSILLNH